MVALSPPASATGRRTVVRYKALVARRYWRSALITGVFTPSMYVLALGIGLGKVIDQHGNGQLGVPYLVFVAPAFLTAAALQLGAADAAFPVTAGFKWERFYHAMAATPLSPRQICDGELTWIAIRLLANSLLYLGIMSCFGASRSPWVLLAVPIAMLTGMAFAAPVAAIAATTQKESNLFNTLFRFVVAPMFLFSGTFYPISQLPQWGQVLAWISPLWHGTELARAAGLGGGLTAAAVAGHLAYLLAWLVAGVLLARWRFRVRLTR